MDPTYEDPALAAYESFAPFYDQYTHDYEYDVWLANIEQAALSHGLHGSRLLDVACGTGKSFLPMLRRGYEVTACDISPAMVARARQAAEDQAEVLVADARELPVLGRFDLVTSIDDALNYLLSDEELAMAFEGVARNLRPGGIFAFDLNTLGGYKRNFPGDYALDLDGTFFCWRGLGSGPAGPGETFTSIVDIFATDDGECWRRYSSKHVQRHHPPDLVERLLGVAGLELVGIYGQLEGGRLERCADQLTHTKVDYFARRHASRSAPRN